MHRSASYVLQCSSVLECSNAVTRQQEGEKSLSNGLEAVNASSKPRRISSLTVHDVVVHLVLGPHAALVAVRVHAVVHVVNVRPHDVPVHVHIIENFGVGPSLGMATRTQ